MASLVRDAVVLCLLGVLTHFFTTKGEIVEEVQGDSLLAGRNHIYGNDVAYRTNYLPSGARKSWIDAETELPAGRLRLFVFYAHPVTSDEPFANLTLQIWRPQEVDFHFTLVWEEQVTIRLDYPIGALYTFYTEDGILVQKSDRIGWQNEGTIGPISFNYQDNHRTYFRQITDNTGPLVGESYQFDQKHLPSVHSVAVQIENDSPGQVFSTTAAESDDTTVTLETETSEDTAEFTEEINTVVPTASSPRQPEDGSALFDPVAIGVPVAVLLLLLLLIALCFWRKHDAPLVDECKIYVIAPVEKEKGRAKKMVRHTVPYKTLSEETRDLLPTGDDGPVVEAEGIHYHDKLKAN